MQKIKSWIEAFLAQKPIDILRQTKQDLMRFVIRIDRMAIRGKARPLSRKVFVAVRKWVEPGVGRLQGNFVDRTDFHAGQLQKPSPKSLAILFAIHAVAFGTTAEVLRRPHAVGTGTAPHSHSRLCTVLHEPSYVPVGRR